LARRGDRSAGSGAAGDGAAGPRRAERAWPLALAIGERDARFIGGFHEPEHFGGMTARWTDGAATLLLPRPPASAPTVLSLELLNARPLDTPTPHLQLSADGRPLGAFDVVRHPNGARRYSLLVPAADRLDWAVRIGLVSDVLRLPSDPRPLGVVLGRATLAPTSAPYWPSRFALLLHLHDRPVTLARAAALALSFGLIGYGNQWSFYDGTVMGVLTITGISYKFYGILLLGGVIVGELLAERSAIRWPGIQQVFWRGGRVHEQR
jgi:hypothetical protein